MIRKTFSICIEILLLITIFGCSAPLLKTPQRAPSEEQTETTNINEAKKNAVQAQQNAKSLAEYHFSMAQAYVAEGNPDRAIEEYKLALVFDPNSPLIHTRLVAEYIKKGSLSDAMESCKEALKIDPNYIDALLILAGLYSATHEQELALKEYDKILKKLPAHEETIVYKVQILNELNRPLEAVKILKQFIKKYNKESQLAWYYLGRSYQKLKQEKNAIEAYNVALKIKPTFYQAALSLGSIYEEKKTYPKALAIYKEIFSQTQDLIAANRIVTILLKEEKYKEALPFLDSISVLDADDMNSQVKLGLVQMELKSYNQAIETFKKILEKNPESERVHYYLGSLYEETKNSSGAIAEFKKVNHESKLFLDSALHVAYLIKQQNGRGSAKTYIEEVISKSPKNVSFYLFQANLEEEEKNYIKATSILEKALVLFQDDEKIRYYLGSLYEKIGLTDKSLVQMEKILAINPDNIDALNFVGYTWTTKGMRLDDAGKMLKKALSLKPNNAYIQDSWGWYLFVRGQFKEAVRELEKAVKLKPDESTILEHLGDAYVKLNLREKAIAKYEEAIKIALDEDAKKTLESKIVNLKQEKALAKPLPDLIPVPEKRIPAAQ